MCCCLTFRAVANQAGGLITYGKDERGQDWAIIKASKGIRIDRTSAYERVKHSPQHCWALLDHAMGLAVNEILHVYSKTHWLHTDPVLTNVLFDDAVSKAYLIDWGCAHKDGRTPAESVSTVSFHIDLTSIAADTQHIISASSIANMSQVKLRTRSRTLDCADRGLQPTMPPSCTLSLIGTAPRPPTLCLTSCRGGGVEHGM